MLFSAMFQSGSMQVDDSLFGFVQEHAMIEQNKASGGLIAEWLDWAWAG